jgi:hypothetical protein
VNGVGAQYETRLSVQIVNIDDPRYQYLQDYYGVTSVPTLVILDPTGATSDIFPGGTDILNLQAAIDRALAR